MKYVEWIPSSDENKKEFAPFPIKKQIPDWYKKIPAFNEKKAEFDENRQCTNASLKMCMPFFDAITSGYVQVTWTDIFIKKKGVDQFICTWKMGPTIVGHRNSVNLPIDTNMYYNTELVWKEPWIPVLPDGYSMLYTHPLNRLDLPFTSLSAIIDADQYHHTFGGSHPFYIKKDFEGIIPAGTPMYQMIPIKRDSWTGDIKYISQEEKERLESKISRGWFFRYKKLFWQKKEYH